MEQYCAVPRASGVAWGGYGEPALKRCRSELATRATLLGQVSVALITPVLAEDAAPNGGAAGAVIVLPRQDPTAPAAPRK
jgi:hypothetical protein